MIGSEIECRDRRHQIKKQANHRLAGKINNPMCSFSCVLDTRGRGQTASQVNARKMEHKTSRTRALCPPSLMLPDSAGWMLKNSAWDLITTILHCTDVVFLPVASFRHLFSSQIKLLIIAYHPSIGNHPTLLPRYIPFGFASSICCALFSGWKASPGGAGGWKARRGGGVTDTACIHLHQHINHLRHISRTGSPRLLIAGVHGLPKQGN